MRDISALRIEHDFVDSLTLLTPTPSEGLAWLRKEGWDEENLNQIEPLLEPGSFSLRPIFLKKLGERSFVEGIAQIDIEDTLTFLVDTMVMREATKFGQPVEAVMSHKELQLFVRAFLGEVARDMSDNQSEAADETSIKWAAEIALSRMKVSIPEEITRLLLNRALVIAFLTNDDRPRYRRFSHTQLQNYFLARETIDVICRPEIPKYLRRNLFSADFLITFSDALDEVAARESKVILDFIKSCQKLFSEYVGTDRGAKNLAALILCCSPFAEMTEGLSIYGANIDEAVVRGSSGKTVLKECSINLLDIRDADVSYMDFQNCVVGGLIVNVLSHLNQTLRPSYIQFDLVSQVDFFQGEEDVGLLLSDLGGAKIGGADSLSPDRKHLEKHPIFALLQRALRFRAYWIRAGAERNDVLTYKIVADPYWEELTAILQKHDFLRKETRDASGRPSHFYHLRRPDILADKDNSDSTAFYADLYKFAQADFEAAN
jgi:hypothetical protein